MPVQIDLTDDQLSLVNAAVERQHQMKALVATATHGGLWRQSNPTDKPTPSAASYANLETMWRPTLTAIYGARPATPAGALGVTGPQKILVPAFIPQTTAAKPPPTPPLPPQLGPFVWNPIQFGGTDCYGQVQLTLYSNGAYNFNGSFTDPDIYDLDHSLAFGVVSSTGVLYMFTHTGSMHGWGLRWLEGGSETDTWSNQGTSLDIQAGWADLCAGWRWQANAGVNVQIGSLLEEVQKIIGVVETIIKLIQIV